MKQFISTVAALLLATTLTHAHEEAHQKIHAIDHAPIGVMGDHRHKAGEWMIGLRYMQHTMNDLSNANGSISSEEVALSGQRMTPLRMEGQMAMIGAMYAPSDRVTLVAGTKYLDKSMTTATYQGMMGSTLLGENTVETEGFGDVKLSALIGLHEQYGHRFHANLSLSLPTGSITEQDEVLMPTGMVQPRRLGYGMQLGSGTYDVTTGLTYVGMDLPVSVGAQYLATWRLGRNDQGYSLGDLHQATTWVAYQPVCWVSGSVRLAYQHLAAIDGRDDQIMANPENSGRERVDIGFGLNFAGFDRHRIAVEYLQPIAESVQGTQLTTDSQLVVGYQVSF